MQKGTGWNTPPLKLRIKRGAVPRLCRKTDDFSLRTGEEQIGPEIRERIHVRYVQRLLLPRVLEGKSPLSFFPYRWGYIFYERCFGPSFFGWVPEERVGVSHSTLVIHGLYLWLSCFIPAFLQQETTGRC